MSHQAHLPALLQIQLPARLLVVAAGHVGNNIFCTPAIQLLRNALPRTTIDVVALNSTSANVFKDNVAISRVHVMQCVWRMARLASRYEQVVCLHPKSIFLLKHVSVPVVAIPPFDSHRHYAEQILTFAASLVGRAIEDSDRRYHLAPAKSDQFFAAPHSFSGPRIGIHLGCGRTAIHGWKFFYRKRDNHPKLWSTEAYVTLAEQLRELFPNALFVITGTRNERFLARRFAKNVKGTIDLTGKTSVNELTKTIGELDLFITQDCGVLHVAAATSTPLLALFGPTCPTLTGPWPPAAHHHILQASNMAEITPQMAASAAIVLLRQHSLAAQKSAKRSVTTALNNMIVASAFWLQQYDFLNGGYVASSYTGLL